MRRRRSTSDYTDEAYDFFVVVAGRLRAAVPHRQACQPRARPPARPRPSCRPEQLDVLRQNTIGYLDRQNLKRIRELGGRPKRGLLLTGPPGNGKTSACRWLSERVPAARATSTRMVSPDAYQAGPQSCNPVQAVKDLFAVHRRGIIFFDDMDIALRDREHGEGDRRPGGVPQRHWTGSR